MPWKQGYTISNEIGLRDDEVRWPHGNRCCVTVVVDLSVSRGPGGIRARDLSHPDAYFAAHDGLDQVLAVLRRFGFKATFAVPAVIAQLRAERLRALVAEGHEIAGEWAEARGCQRTERGGREGAARSGDRYSDPRDRAAGRRAGSVCRGRMIRSRVAPSARIRWIC